MLARCDLPLLAMQRSVAAKENKKDKKKNATGAAAAVIGDHDNITMGDDDDEFTSSNEDNGDNAEVKDDFHGPELKKSKTEGAPSASRDGAATGSADAPARSAAAPAAADAGSAAAADASVFPVPSQFDLLSAMMSNLTSMVGGIQMEMKAHNQQFSHLDSKITQIEANLDTKMDARFEAFKSEVNLRMETLSLASSSAAQTPPVQGIKAPVRANSNGGAPPGRHSSSPPSRSTAARSTTASSSSAATDADCKLIALGFPRTLPRPALLGWWEEVRTQVPLDIQCKGSFQGGTGKAFSVVFPSKADARAFTAFVSTNRTVFCWTSPRADETPYTINFRADRSIEEKDRGRALAAAWRILSPQVKDSSKFDPSVMKFVTDTRRGTIAVATGKDMWDLVKLSGDDGKFTISTFDDSFNFFNISLEVAEAVRISLAATPSPQ